VPQRAEAAPGLRPLPGEHMPPGTVRCTQRAWDVRERALLPVRRPAYWPALNTRSRSRPCLKASGSRGARSSAILKGSIADRASPL
jgi:hypothetical protein